MGATLTWGVLKVANFSRAKQTKKTIRIDSSYVYHSLWERTAARDAAARVWEGFPAWQLAQEAVGVHPATLVQLESRPLSVIYS